LIESADNAKGLQEVVLITNVSSEESLESHITV
jgi:hypothetical protein